MFVLNFDYTQMNNSISNSISPVSAKNFNASKILEETKFEDCNVLNSPIVLNNAFFVADNLLKISEE
jgi:hypothetical protein